MLMLAWRRVAQLVEMHTITVEVLFLGAASVLGSLPQLAQVGVSVLVGIIATQRALVLQYLEDVIASFALFSLSFFQKELRREMGCFLLLIPDQISFLQFFLWVNPTKIAIYDH
jgi:hypothetical protein